MSLHDPMGSDQVTIVKDLERRIAALETLVRTVTGAPVTKASSAFLLPNTAPAGTPASGIYLYVSGTTLRQRDSTGTDRAVGNSAANVIVPGITAPDAPGGYSQAQAQAISDGLATTYNSLIALIVSLRNGGILIV